MKIARLVLIGLVVLVVTLGLGYAWGASGRRTAEQAANTAQQQLDVARATSTILEARVSLYNVNFGDAQKELADAAAPLERARQRYQDEGKREAADAIAAAIAHVQEAQRLASKLDPSANNLASQALTAIRTAESK